MPELPSPNDTVATQFDASNVAILGAGAIGQLIWHQLTAACGAQSPLLITRQLPTNQSLPITLQITPHMTFQNAQRQDAQRQSTASVTARANVVETRSLEASQLAHIRLLIVCVKAYQVTAAVTSLLDKLPKHCHILLLHNGMGPHLEVQQLISDNLSANLGLSLGTTSQAALKVSEQHIQHTGTGKTVIGHMAGSHCPQDLLLLLTHAIPQLSVQQNIIEALWHKLLINCAINPLTAIEQCRNGQLALPHYQQQINAIIDECILVAKADGIILPADHMQATVMQVIHATAENYSSMRQDVHFQRPTEIAQINGYVVNRAQAHQLEVRHNQKLANRINKITQLQQL
ncbi:2-dehydropantoate 2-reductase [Shewanella maritima]|uniref:2-dehydropantoate 2-reductase n=1 Tax=Shewanella maritima TaxID=2520507 RepID=UPI003736F73E